MSKQTDAAEAVPEARAELMSKGEREELQRLVRQREKVLKSAAKQRSAELEADFENQMGQEFSFDQDAVWAQLAKDARGGIAPYQPGRTTRPRRPSPKDVAAMEVKKVELRALLAVEAQKIEEALLRFTRVKRKNWSRCSRITRKTKWMPISISFAGRPNNRRGKKRNRATLNR